MKKMNKLTIAALALAAMGIASTAASAQTVSAGPDDLILGFQLQNSVTPVASDLEVDLGSSSLYSQTSSFTNLTQLSVNDLNTVFTSSWSSTTSGTGVNWSILGANTNGTGANGTSIAQVGSVRTSDSGTVGTLIEDAQVYTTGSTGAGSLNGAMATATGAAAVIGSTSNPLSNLPNSYTEQWSTGPSAYGALGLVTEQTGAGTAVLYDFEPGTKPVGKGSSFPLAVELGVFTLSSSGVLSYNGIDAGASPEPSAYALGICALLLFWVLKRRHSVA
jgi:hypothetical protein